jgi:glycosyltransferase involved in cell wall biosynthesis
VSFAELQHLPAKVGGMTRLLFKPAEDYALSLREVGLRKRAEFLRLRQTPSYREAYRKSDPLVSILIATYNRAQLVCERAVRSCLSQTYANIEVIVVGDCCTDDTAKLMAAIPDKRLKFVNLPERGNYPADPKLRWMVAGSAPMNHGLSLANGDFITHLDDDDEHAPERVQVLMDHIRETGADLLYHPFRFELPDGTWQVNQAESFRFQKATTSSIFYHRHFRQLGWNPLAYRTREPGDWNRLRRIRFLGADIRRHPGILLTHYRERNQKPRETASAAP